MDIKKAFPMSAWALHTLTSRPSRWLFGTSLILYLCLFTVVRVSLYLQAKKTDHILELFTKIEPGKTKYSSIKNNLQEWRLDIDPKYHPNDQRYYSYYGTFPLQQLADHRGEYNDNIAWRAFYTLLQLPGIRYVISSGTIAIKDDVVLGVQFRTWVVRDVREDLRWP